ncbi:MAG: TonB-dependent receptor [Tannerella sp.]|nr:TonB-dependent receptor [Tannerella sp.]
MCLLLFLSGFVLAEDAKSQNARVSLNKNQAELKEVLDVIEHQTDYLFISNVDIDLERKVSIRTTNKPVREVLDKLFENTGLSYAMEGVNIILSKRTSTAPIAVAQQQTRQITGVIVDDTGEPVIGANIVEKGTTNGIITDEDGKFTLNLTGSNPILQISYIGYSNQEITVGDQTFLQITLREDTQALEEVVVVGYGVMKKKLLTGATVQVSGDDIQKRNSTSALGALQSQTPGVNIVQKSGKPGEGFNVTIRGMGTIGDAKPLYVVDGIAGIDINNLNPSDIESVDVLKDAASAAIYGARAANGVVLVTTKQGKSGKIQLSYDSYYGVQNIYKMPPLLNAREYMVIEDETRFNEGNGVYNWSNEIPKYLLDGINNGTWAGTNWLKESLNKDAAVQNHSFNLIGGNDVSKFSLGFSYVDQEGIVGKQVDPSYKRYTARVNSEHVLLKVNDFDAIKIGENILFTHSSNKGSLATGNMFYNSVHDLLITTPLLPIYNGNGGWYDQTDKSREGWNLQGSIGNPLAAMALSNIGNNFSRSSSLNASAYIEIQPIKNLKYRSVFGYKQSSYQNNGYNGIRNLSTEDVVSTDMINQSGNAGYSITWENTLSYNFILDQVHTFDAVVGQSLEKWGMGQDMNISAANSVFPGQFKYAYISNAKPTALSEVTVGGSPWGQGALASFFGRVNYNYKETYMASVVLRTDGSSNFARGHRWGYFPSFSAGWVITNENFMESLRDKGLDFLKLRGSWGQNGNASISNFQYLATIAMDNSNSYYFGDTKESPTTGAYADILPNPDVTWETSEQLDFGFDARVLRTRLGVNFDWYRKTTKDWLVVAPMLSSYGTGAPYINGGDVLNQGIELGLDWRDKVGNFTYSVNWNISQNKNEVLRIANTEKIIHGPSNVLSQGTTEMFRAEVGKPIGFFWGFKTDGVFQNQAQIDEYRAANKGVLDSAQPGDLIFRDEDGDGGITDDDKVMLGDPTPDFNSGLTLSFGYKGLDLSLTAYGAFGMQIAKSYRSFADSPLQNYTTDIFGRWHGEGTSNKLPRITSGSHSNWQYISDIYFEDADYVKIQNITLGYDFKHLYPSLPLGQVRLFVTAQNLFTFTGYSGMDPEVGYNFNDNSGDYNWSSGIDLGFYPSTRKYLVGVNIKF